MFHPRFFVKGTISALLIFPFASETDIHGVYLILINLKIIILWHQMEKTPLKKRATFQDVL
jgi:hypothetical protein